MDNTDLLYRRAAGRSADEQATTRGWTRSKRGRLRSIGLVVAIVASSASSSQPAGAEVDVVPAPLGQTMATDARGTCPIDYTCTGVAVFCDEVPGLVATVALKFPTDPAVPTRGLVLFVTGADGVVFYSGLDPSMTESGRVMDDIRNQGFVVAQFRWDSPGWQTSPIDQPNGPATQACLPATVMSYVHDTYFVPLGITRGRRKCGFCVTGNSGGGSVLGYALARYGLDPMIARAVLSSGPTHASLTKGCYSEDGYKYATDNRRHIDLTYGFADDTSLGPCNQRDPAYADEFERDSLVSSTVAGDFAHPDTAVTMVMGELDSDRWHNMAQLYEDVLVGAGTIATTVVVPGAGHNLRDTPAGMGAIRAALLNPLAPPSGG